MIKYICDECEKEIPSSSKIRLNSAWIITKEQTSSIGETIFCGLKCLVKYLKSRGFKQ